MHALYFFFGGKSMNLSELLIIFVNKVLITPTQGFKSLHQHPTKTFYFNFLRKYILKTVIRDQRKATSFSVSLYSEITKIILRA